LVISFILNIPIPPSSTPLPYTTLFRSHRSNQTCAGARDSFMLPDDFSPPNQGIPRAACVLGNPGRKAGNPWCKGSVAALPTDLRSEEHTSELQSLAYLVCRLLLEKKND